MKIVEGTRPFRTRPYPQPANGQRTAASPGSRDEKALPRSEPGIKQIRTSRFNDYIVKLEDSLRLGNTNWVVWQAHMITKFQRCGVEGYVNGTIPCPDPADDLDGVENWSCNDNFARVLISWNVTASEQVHILGCDSAHEMWKNLEDVHGSRSHGFSTMLAQRRKLHCTTAKEGDNIVEHLDKLKQSRDRFNFAAIGGESFEISDSSFVKIIAASLPGESWDSFTCNRLDDLGMVSPQRFIDLIKREYWYREQRDRENIRTHMTT
jgi:hypothetical protein